MGSLYVCRPLLLTSSDLSPPTVCMQYRNQILYLVEKYRTVVIIGETGCGKTTQVRSCLSVSRSGRLGFGGKWCLVLSSYMSFIHAYSMSLVYPCSIRWYQIPQYLHEANWTGNGFVVGITQPRRVAATTVSPSLPSLPSLSSSPPPSPLHFSLF